MTFNKKLENLRENNDWNKSEVARKLNIPQTTYMSYESGKHQPDIERLKIIADLYHVSVDYLLDHDVVQPNFVMPKEISNESEARYFLNNLTQLTNKMSSDELVKFAQTIFYISTKK